MSQQQRWNYHLVSLPTRGKTRLLFGILFISTVSLTTVFTLSRQSTPQVEAPWHRVQKSIPDLAPQQHLAKPVNCESREGEDLSWLSTYKLSPTFQYAARDIVVVQNETSGRPLVTEVREPLFKHFSTVKLDESHTLNKTECQSPLILEVAQAPLQYVDASHIIFGMQTTITRLRDTVKHVARWLPHTGAQLYSIVVGDDDAPVKPQEMVLVEQQYRTSEMNVTIRAPLKKEHSFAQRYFSIVEMLYAARTPDTKWIAVMDDDTFFPSMKALTKMLGALDHTKEFYVGSVSEDWNAVNLYGFMGFGGAGIFLSLPLAKVIVDHKEVCNNNLRSTAGDVTILDCIYRFTDTKLTRVNGLHQMDLYDDQSGFYESGREILSTHHWKLEPALAIEKMHLVSDICGQCFLQRWQFPEDILLSNGYSITHYPLGHLSGNIKRPVGKLISDALGVKNRRSRRNMKQRDEKELTEKEQADKEKEDKEKEDKEKEDKEKEDKEKEDKEKDEKEREERERKEKEEKDEKEREERERKEKEKKLYNSKIDLLAIEQTWKYGDTINVDHSLAPVRPKAKDDMKVSFLLLDAVTLENGSVRQIYVKKGEEGKDDQVIVLNWMASDETKAGR